MSGYSNFITPPDVINEEKHNVLLIDAGEEQVQTIAEWCQQANSEFNVYVAEASMLPAVDWLKQVVQTADAIIVNTVPNQLSPAKDRLAELHKSWYYGPKRFLGNNKTVTGPLEYFINFENSVK